MAETQGRVFACRFGKTFAFRLIGRITAEYCPTLRRLAESAWTSGCDSVLFDLHDCVHIDSTFVGTLLYLHRQAAQNDRQTLALVQPSAICQQILRTMGAERLLPVASGKELVSDSTWMEVSAAQQDPGSREFEQAVVEAHQELARSPGPIGDRFRSVAEHLTRDYEARR